YAIGNVGREPRAEIDEQAPGHGEERQFAYLVGELAAVLSVPGDRYAVQAEQVSLARDVLAASLRLAAAAVPDVGLLTVVVNLIEAKEDAAVMRVLPIGPVGQQRLPGLVKDVVIRLDGRIREHLVLRHGVRVEREMREARDGPGLGLSFSHVDFAQL